MLVHGHPLNPGLQVRRHAGLPRALHPPPDQQARRAPPPLARPRDEVHQDPAGPPGWDPPLAERVPGREDVVVETDVKIRRRVALPVLGLPRAGPSRRARRLRRRRQGGQFPGPLAFVRVAPLVVVPASHGDDGAAAVIAVVDHFHEPGGRVL